MLPYVTFDRDHDLGRVQAVVSGLGLRWIGNLVPDVAVGTDRDRGNAE